jgi:hypothetical protein
LHGGEPQPEKQKFGGATHGMAGRVTNQTTLQIPDRYRFSSSRTYSRYYEFFKYDRRGTAISREGQILESFGWNYKPAEKYCWLIFCERKILFQLKKQAE